MVLVLRQRGVEAPSRVGFVVSAAVGNSVVRHRVTRRLRAQVRPLLPLLPAGSDLVIRALPPSSKATSRELRESLERCLAMVLKERRRRAEASG